ncbi:hypothetical protein M0802_003211 [Mischocyttarus mexicanus]|nr:hypothetical protein M0802_003211 [Mischocyttarus mexicanus]
MENGSKLLFLLVKVSEKAANIARVCKQNQSLFDLLVQEKSQTEENPLYKDFKTLADVLIQETIKHDIALEFPELAKVVQGEENNTFTNVRGKTIIVEVCSTCLETTNLLAEVMGNDIENATFLAEEVHKEIQLKDVNIMEKIPNHFNLPMEDLGIWVDPIGRDLLTMVITCSIDETISNFVIDGTGHYVKSCADAITLNSVTVLIGVYLRSTGLPVLGIINKPFDKLSENQKWNGLCYWGYVNTDTSLCCTSIGRDFIGFTEETSKTILISQSEDKGLVSKLRKAGFILIITPGAGYKSLKVALGLAAAYFLSKSSTYKWDTCAPHTILKALGGGIIDYQQFLKFTNFKELDLKYDTTSDNAANSGGLIAYRNIETLVMLKKILC